MSALNYTYAQISNTSRIQHFDHVTLRTYITSYMLHFDICYSNYNLFRYFLDILDKLLLVWTQNGIRMVKIGLQVYDLNVIEWSAMSCYI